MIVNAFTWMNLVLKSFSAIGASVTGLPALSPQSVIVIGASMAETIFNSPATSSTLSNLELAIVQSVAAFFVLLSFVIAAAMLLLTLIEILSSRGRWSHSARLWRKPLHGARSRRLLRLRHQGRRPTSLLLSGAGSRREMANDWNTALVAACKPTPMFLPWFGDLRIFSIVTRYDGLCQYRTSRRNA